MKARPVPELDNTLKQDIENLVKAEPKEVNTEPTPDKSRIEINTVNLDTVIRFESKANIETKENEKNGRNDLESEGERDRREASVPKRTRKGGFIY
jgi:hypothetical protein